VFAYTVKRILLVIPLMLGASIITFSVMYLTPGDPVEVMLGERSQDRALVEKMRSELGLNDPAPVQYGRFLRNLVWQNPDDRTGRSIRTNQPIREELKSRLPATIELTLVGLLIALSIGLAAGILSAIKQYSALDYASMLFALGGVSIPVFWLALLLSYFFSVQWDLLPLEGRMSLMIDPVEPVTGLLLVDSVLRGRWDAFLDALQHLILPGATLGVVSAALIARMTRSSMLEVKHQDFIRTARAKGLAPHSVLWHTLRNALIPVVTVVGLQFGALLGGAIITETIFSWPGVGSYLIQRILWRDIFAVQYTVMMITGLFILVNLAVDLLYSWIDPRIQYS
jgi:peptide/nickel transport system permease protein